MFEIEINQDLNFLGSFRKWSDKTWKNFNNKEILKAEFKGINLEISGLNGAMKIIMKIFPLNFSLKSKPKFMNIGLDDQSECNENNVKLEDMIFNKNGGKLIKKNGIILNKNDKENILGKRDLSFEQLSKENIFFDKNNKKLKISNKIDSHRQYFDLRNFYQSGKGSVQIKNNLENKNENLGEENLKMTKSVQKIDYYVDKKLNDKRERFISPLKTVIKPGEKRGRAEIIKEFNPEIMYKTNKLFEKTPSREEEINSKNEMIQCDNCKERSKEKK